MEIAVQANGLARSKPAKHTQSLHQTSLQLLQRKQRAQQPHHLQQQHPSASQQQAASPELPPLAQTLNRQSLQPTTQRRNLLLGGIAAGVCLIPVSSSQAAVTVTLRPKPQLKPYTLKAGYSVTVPDSWGLAYVSGIAATPAAAAAASCHCHTTFLGAYKYSLATGPCS
jgi:hypothetical protein